MKYSVYNHRNSLHAAASRPLMRLEHVSKIYSPGTAQQHRALQDISLEIGRANSSALSALPAAENPHCCESSAARSRLQKALII